MADDLQTGGTTRSNRNWMVWFPLGIAVLSLVSSIFQSLNYARNIESAQQNVLRVESLKTCRDIIEVFFQFRLKAEEFNRMGIAARASKQPVEAISANDLKAVVYKFGALGTFLANFREKEARVSYTELTWKLNELAEKSVAVSAEEFSKLFNDVDARFDSFNQDCVKAAQGKLL
jgi:hypothetical protein